MKICKTLEACLNEHVLRSLYKYFLDSYKLKSK